jgi:hypothetical protein
MLTKLDVTFDIDVAINYYKEVERTCQDIRWQIPDDFFLTTLRGIYGWSLSVPKEADPNKPFGLYQSVRDMGLNNYQDTKAAFGFGRSLMNIFPMAYRFAVGVTPPGIYAPPHRDSDPDRDALRGWVPFINNPSIKWITEEGILDLHPGNVYIIDIAKEHEFINEGDLNGVGMVFDIYRHDLDRVKQINGRIE